MFHERQEVANPCILQAHFFLTGTMVGLEMHFRLLGMQMVLFLTRRYLKVRTYVELLFIV